MNVSALASGVAVFFGLWSGTASAQDGQSPAYGPDTLTFETWCHDIRRYPAERCARKDQADLAAYKTTLDRMQAFESEQQKKVRKDREFREQFESHGKVEPSQQPGE